MKALISVHNLKDTEKLYHAAVDLLSDLIRIPSFSREEDKTAERIVRFFSERDIPAEKIINNVVAQNKHFDPSKPTLLLNSHHDTVKPNKNYTREPFEANIENGRLFGLGSNDAGASLVSLMAAFCYYYDNEDMQYNLLFAASAEEEISGSNGIEQVLKKFPDLSFGIVGEPTLLRMAVAERGLMVLDGLSKGVAGHAAREEGVNAIYQAIEDIEKLRTLQFEKVSDLLGPVKVSVTSIFTDNKAHNVVPAECRFIADIRLNELYTHEEVLEKIQAVVKSEVKPRTMRMRSSMIAKNHPLVEAGNKLGLEHYGSPTTSDKALMKFPTLKIGPGDSARSHTADEFVYTSEIREGIETYIQLIKNII